MKTWARIRNGLVVETRPFAGSWTPSPGLVEKGFDWRPVREVVPEYDACRQRLGPPAYTVADAEVIAAPVVIDDPAAYQELRRAAYPDPRDLCDAEVKIASGDATLAAQGQAQKAAYIAACLDVKARYPKPEAANG